MAWLKQNWIKIGIGIAILGVLVFANGWSRWSKNNAITLKCPESYKNSDEKIADLKKFADDFYAKNPTASEVDLAKEMLNAWKANNCSLKRYNDFIAGNVDADTKAMIYGLVDQYTNAKTYASKELGFSFMYPNTLDVGVDPENSSRLFIIPISVEVNKEPMTAIIISEATDNPEMTAEQWLNGQNSGYKATRDGQYKNIKIGGQDAVITPDDWTVVKSPDGQRRISIAYLVEQDKGAKPLHQELQMILDTFSFK